MKLIQIDQVTEGWLLLLLLLLHRLHLIVLLKQLEEPLLLLFLFLLPLFVGLDGGGALLSVLSLFRGGGTNNLGQVPDCHLGHLASLGDHRC